MLSARHGTHAYYAHAFKKLGMISSRTPCEAPRRKAFHFSITMPLSSNTPFITRCHAGTSWPMMKLARPMWLFRAPCDFRVGIGHAISPSPCQAFCVTLSPRRFSMLSLPPSVACSTLRRPCQRPPGACRRCLPPLCHSCAAIFASATPLRHYLSAAWLWRHFLSATIPVQDHHPTERF